MNLAARARKLRTPGRGDVLPDLTGPSPSGGTVRTRDFYMRRNLVVLLARDDETSRDWLRDAAEVREAAHAEDGEILLVVTEPVETYGMPAIADGDRSLVARLGLSVSDLPALYITDRYGTIFVANKGEQAAEDLQPRDIPGWLEFIACRCS